MNSVQRPIYFGKRQTYLLMKQSMKQKIDPQNAKLIQKHRNEGLGWRYDGLGDWTTEAIFDKLRELGVDTSLESFPDQAKSAGRCAVLEVNWVEGLDLEAFWTDFAFLAVEELWERLTPDLWCPEILSNRLEAVIGRSKAIGEGPVLQEEERAEVDMAVTVAKYLEEFPKDDRAIWFYDILDCGTYDYSSWLLDLVLDYGPRYPIEMTYVADIISECENAELFQGDLAFALAVAGRREEALERVDLNLERFPEHVWIRILAGDVHEKLGESEEAAKLYAEALAMAVEPYDWEGVVERLEPLLDQLDRGAQWNELKRRYPKPADPSAKVLPGRLELTQDNLNPSGPIGILTNGPSPKITTVPGGPQLYGKIGRNEPCPCGSGRKYKKCCMGRD